MARRKIIFHSHLFKNAGTSIDAMLRRNFGARWVQAEFTQPRRENARLIAEWITANPEAVAFSTHTLSAPLPELPGVEIHCVLALRDPIDRIKSAYRFERTQQADTLGARLARSHSFEDYVAARIKAQNDRQCRNFQTAKLAQMHPGDAPELQRATKAMRHVSVLGLVEDMPDMTRRLADLCADLSPMGDWSVAHKNRAAQTPEAPLSSDAFDTLLRDINQNDLSLLHRARMWLNRADTAPSGE